MGLSERQVAGLRSSSKSEERRKVRGERIQVSLFFLARTTVDFVIVLKILYFFQPDIPGAAPFIGEVLGVKAVPIEYRSEGKRRTLGSCSRVSDVDGHDGCDDVSRCQPGDAAFLLILIGVATVTNRPPMKLRTFILCVCGFIVPLWGASSQGIPSPSPSPSPSSSPAPISTLEPSKIDPLVRVRQMVENDPRNAPDIVTKAIQADPEHSIFYAGEVVRSAIRGLGNSTSEVAISFLIAAAVNARPQAALQIVRVAVGETPPKLHAAIVAAAVADVPDPYEDVIIVRRRERYSEPPPVIEKRKAFTVSKVFMTDGESATPDDKSVVAEGKAVATEGKEPVGPEVLSYEPGTGPGSMTLAEAIIQAAIEGGSTAGLDALTNSVNLILLSTTPPLEGDPAHPNTDMLPLPTPSPVSP